MAIHLSRINYDSDLNPRQKENYNFQKVSSILADYGFMTMRLSDDWQGADFIAQHIDGETFLRVQLKSRLTFSIKYHKKDIYAAFLHKEDLYLYPHDELLQLILEKTNVEHTDSWKKDGEYSFPKLSSQIKELLEPFKIPSKPSHIVSPDFDH
jgi:hypothetical protein